jgi:DNA-binding transcriptional LysR family regulator
MDPTPCASELAKLYDDISKRLETINASMTSFDPATSVRSFRLQANDYAIYTVMGRALALLRKEAPMVSVTIDYVPDMDFRARLETGEVDMNIGYMPDIDESLHRSSLFSVEICCIARKPHALFDGEISLAAYLDAPHLCLSLGRGDLASFLDRTIDGLLAELGHIRTKAAQVPTWLTMPSIVAETDLIATVPRDVAISAARTLPIQVLDLPFKNFNLDLSVVWHSRLNNDPSHRWLRGIFHSLGAETASDHTVR